MKIPSKPPKPNTPSADVATQQWVSTYYTTKSTRPTTYRKNSILAVANTITETDLLNGEITIGAGVMGTNRLLRLTAAGDLIQNGGGAQALPRFKLKLGASTLIDTSTVAGSWSTSAARYAWRVLCEVGNLGAANSQWTSFRLDYCGSIVAGFAQFATGEGLYWANGVGDTVQAFAGGSSAVDTTAAQALALTVILPVANAAVDVTLKHAVVEVV